jgi:CRISPR-associated endoribonuclease Cas2
VAQETTLYIIAYDIPNDRRRSKVHKTLCGYGAWTQYSLFECWLDRKQLLELQIKLAKQLNEQEDSLRLYPLCQSCQGKVITIGSSLPSEPKSFVF